jgi:cytoskeletal protein CcmA (bactofilin family)
VFSKKKINPNTTDTMIGKGSAFEGKIISEASIRIEGKYKGNIQCTGDVTIGEEGSVQSDIEARNVYISGTIHGNITTKGKIIISSTGKLFGNMSAQTFVIDEGGVFQGSSRMPLPESKGSKESDINKDQNEPGQSHLASKAQ